MSWLRTACVAVFAWSGAAAAQDTVPSEWLEAGCYASSYGTRDGCDCGCAVADPDCDGVTNDVTLCSSINCQIYPQVPAADDVTACVANVCGDHVAYGDESCDDGDGEGCSADCMDEAEGFVCDWASGRGCHREDVCGDGFLDWSEACDDGNTTAGDGCSADCQELQAGFACDEFNGCREVVCGDGFVDYADTADGDYISEGCDDGNTVDGDGCKADCSDYEEGYTCERPGHPCRLYGDCGDGIYDYYAESCDDGNEVAGDGCEADCQSVTPGYACPYTGGACHQIVCGDGTWDAYAYDPETYEPYEPCEDGNTNANDGCSATCTVEEGFVCSYDYEGGSDLSVCHAVVCGDGIWDSYDYTTYEYLEACEDGNTSGGDGCDASCAIESGWTCGYDYTGGSSLSDCHQVVCGDGVWDQYDYTTYEDLEECEDGNTNAGDGCDGDCQVEEGWDCSWGDCVELPEGFTCPSSYLDYYGTGDGCDCGCGIPDDDCPDATAESCEYNNCPEGEPNAQNNAYCGDDAPPPGGDDDGGTPAGGDGGTLDSDIDEPDVDDRVNPTLFGDCSATSTPSSGVPFSLALLALLGALAARRRE